jgi:hypothetical protein
VRSVQRKATYSPPSCQPHPAKPFGVVYRLSASRCLECWPVRTRRMRGRADSCHRHEGTDATRKNRGNLPLSNKQTTANDKKDSGMTVDFKRRDAGVHAIRPVRSLHLLHQSAVWGAMRRESKPAYSSTPRPSSPSGSSLSMSVSDSSATIYNSLGLTPDIAEASERYKHMARTESLAILEGKMQRRASLTWCEMALDRQVRGCQ